jgi:hypothetical protein
VIGSDRFMSSAYFIHSIHRAAATLTRRSRVLGTQVVWGLASPARRDAITEQGGVVGKRGFTK